MVKYKFISHTADIKFQAFGNNLEECFINSFEALNKVIRDEKDIKKRAKRIINVKGNDLKELLYNFLEEFLFLLDAKDFIAGEIKTIKIDAKNFQLSAVVFGDRASNYKISNDVKAITYSDMFIKQKNGKFVVQIVLDV